MGYKGHMGYKEHNTRTTYNRYSHEDKVRLSDAIYQAIKNESPRCPMPDPVMARVLSLQLDLEISAVRITYYRRKLGFPKASKRLKVHSE